MHELIYGSTLSLLNISIALYWMLGLGLLCVRHRDLDHILTSLVLFVISFWMLFATLDVTSSARFIALHIGFSYIRAPLIYFYFLKIIDSRFVFERKQLNHFIPGVLVFILLEALPASNASPWTSLPAMMYGGGFAPYTAAVQVLIIVGLALQFAYLAVLLRSYLPLFLFGKEMHQTLANSAIVWVHIFYTMATTAVVIVEHFIWGQMREASLLLVILFPVLFFFAIMRYPEYIRLVKVETEEINYVRSKIQKLDLDGILKRMENLIQEEKVFLDEKLTLAKLAKELSITPHQLSEILNNKLGKTFNEYINEYRIQEAQRLLIEVPDATVLDIAYDVGFNTKSAFYKSFQKIVGQSPSQYRKANQESA
jgi:AraC-like DNA-binding protein